jgi:hypothetical protein
MLPAMEAYLSINELNNDDPGYQKPAIKIITMFSGAPNIKGKKDYGKHEKFSRRRTTRKEHSLPSTLHERSDSASKYKVKCTCKNYDASCHCNSKRSYQDEYGYD